MSGSRPLVRIRGLRKSFGTHLVLDGIDLDVTEGEVTVLLGPSGSGKCTLLRCVNHLEKPDAGFVEVAGEHHRLPVRPTERLHELRPRAITRQRAQLGMVFQQFNLFPHLTVLENIVEAPVARARPAEAQAGAPRPGNCSTGSAWPAGRAPTRGSCPAGSSSGSPSPARWRWSRGCCSSTSRPARSTPNWSARCWR